MVRSQDRMVSCPALVHVPSKNTFTPKVGQDGWESRIVGDGLTCLTFSACTTQGTHLHQRWARIVEDSPG
jgi:hypothetical protein